LARIIAIANQKGGVGKTTTAINLGACLAVAEKRTLVVDIDPQGNATSGLGLRKEDLSGSIYEVLVEGTPLSEVIVPGVHFPFLDVVPATRDLVGVEVELVTRESREAILRSALEEVRDRYDFILIDAPPSLGLLTLNTLAAADAVLIPIQCEFYALEGLSQLLNTVRLVQKNMNPALQIDGVLLTMYDQRLNLSKQVAEEAKEYFGARVYRTVIPRNVRIAEAPSFGQPIVLYDIVSVGAKSYLSLAREVIARSGPAPAARHRGRREVPTTAAAEE
jgi:chromosome partitioning protein